MFLRGVVEREGDIAGIEAAARRITGVRGVENLLHMPGTPAPASRPKLICERACAPERRADAAAHRGKPCDVPAQTGTQTREQRVFASIRRYRLQRGAMEELTRRVD